MLNRINSRQNHIQFGALKINKPFNEWNTDVLTALLNSRVIKNIIANDAKNGTDTFIKYNELIKPAESGKKGETDSHMILEIFGKSKNVYFKSWTGTRIKNHGLFKAPEKYTIGANNLGQDIAKQIKELDTDSFSIKKEISEINDIVGSIDVTTQI